MKNNIHLGSLAIIAVAMALGSGSAMAQDSSGAPESASANEATLTLFAPRETTNNTRLDYALWDEALQSFVLRMGPSLREGAPRPDPGLGSRVTYGHDSRYRLEGNRVGFGFLEREALAALSAYRADLESLAGQIDIATLPRNEQLAYWINLHNVAVIEQIALNYPVSRPIDIRLGESERPLDETPFITVAGVRMSPKDIRTRIVFPHWRDPKVIYGFFRGEIGGPTIQREAFTGANVSDMLEASATEFVNSLRGTQESGDTLLISEIYAEARPFYFSDWPNAVKRHLLTYGEEDIDAMINGSEGVEARIYEHDIADFSKGKPDPGYNTVYSNDRAQSTRIPADVIRLLQERQNKYEKAIRRGERTGTVRIVDLNLPDEKPEVVE